ncbi:T9SS type A sorting domain-containing protein [Fulvivirga maritima]|uniref:T9SS type A sorting domain-containing protein n=1 Tax=Fulvivirga maritima TaxID=2904247 RepID=UPI001F212934|nr:T9SS type A sorting domain-containing protein [Fulvivirga maritima]UII27487.1 T9SS type A sorting domain-containing protein [Fulvivirga maritima]
MSLLNMIAHLKDKLYTRHKGLISSCLKSLSLIITVCTLAILTVNQAQAQTPGLIIDPAAGGAPILDPNADGYVSADNGGFISNDNTESEIAYQPITVPEVEPTSDVASGPACGFTDFADDATRYVAASYLDASDNWLFRFRLGGFSPNSKGYSILIDTDNLFGSGSDPNYVSGNPGFEIEIELVTNFGVRLYDVDGTTTPTLMTTLGYDDYAQKSIAQSSSCGDFDYFYDFYIPFSTITFYFPSITTSTPMRLVANTVINTQSALSGNISDIGGIDDNAYGNNVEKMWGIIADNQVATAPDDINAGFPPSRSVAPVISSPVSIGATSVSGSSSEATGTVIELLVNNISVGTTTVSGGSWTLSGLTALSENDILTATATASGESVSLFSNEVSVGASCSAAPSITCGGRKGIEVSTTTSLPVGTILNAYNPDHASFPGPISTFTVTTPGTLFVIACNGSNSGCNSGTNCQPNGTYWATVQEPGKCESIPSAPFCTGGGSSASTPPIISTTSVTTSTTTITGTSTSGFKIFLFIDGDYVSTTTANGSGAWSFSGLSLSLGQTLQVRALQSGQCLSPIASRIVTEQSTAPTITGPIVNGATSVSGTSSEASGTVINVRVGGVTVGTTTVDANGNWTVTGLSLSTGQVITATATAPGELVSAASSSFTVLAASATPSITGSYSEGDTSVSGTSPSADGSEIDVYIDGGELGSTNTSAGNWTLGGLNSANSDLYAGGVLTATATESGKAESTPSAGNTVNCQPPLTNRTVNVISNEVCENTTAQVEITNSEDGVIYTLRDNGDTVDKSTSLLGTGGAITFDSFELTASETLQIKALKIPDFTCTGLNSNTAAITVYDNPADDRAITSTATTIEPGESTNIEVANSEPGVEYLLRDDADDSEIGTAVTGTGSTILLPTGNLNTTTTFNVLTTKTSPIICSIEQLNTATVTVNPILPVELISFTAKKDIDNMLVHLKWTTASEINNDFFIIERSSDGVIFNIIGQVKGAGNSDEQLDYHFTDERPTADLSYYRLKQVDFDGSYQYSSIVSIASDQGDYQVLINPNPFDKFTTFRVNGAHKNDQINVTLMDNSGKLMKRLEGGPAIKLYREELSSGLYIYKIYVNKQLIKTGKLIIE